MSRPRNLVLALLAATTGGGAWLAWRQHSELAELRAAALQRSERADLQKRLWDLERRNRSLQDQLADSGSAGNRPASSARPAAGTSPTNPASPEARPLSAFNQLAALRATLAKPEVQALVAVQQKAAIESRYAALFKTLALAPEQTEKLKTLLLDQANTRQDVLAAALEQGLDPRANAAAIQQLIADAQAGTDRALRDVLGDAGVARLRTYEQTEPQRLIVAELQQRLSYTATPLSPDQADRLVSVLAAQPAPPSASAGSPASMPIAASRNADLGTTIAAAVAGTAAGALVGMAESARVAAPITGAAVAEAQTVLSPPQVAALQQLQQQQQAQQQLQRVIRESMPGGTAPRPSPPR